MQSQSDTKRGLPSVSDAMFWLLAIGLRVFLAFSSEPLWYDESFSVILARLPWDRLIAATAADVHPPLYYAVLKLWMTVAGRVAPIEAAARSLSLILSLLALGLYWQLLQTVFEDEPNRWIAMYLCAAIPGMVFFASEARMYALMECLVLLAAIALLSDWKYRPFIAGAALGALVLTHNTGLYYAAALGIATLLRRGRDEIVNVAVAAGVAIAMWVPWLPAFMGQVAETNGSFWVWKPSLGTNAYMLFQAVFYGRAQGWFAVVAMIALGAVTAVAVLRSWRQPWLLVAAFGPMAIGFGVAMITGTGTVIHRMLLPSLFFMAILWARAFDQHLVALCGVTCLLFGAADAQFLAGRKQADYGFMDIIAEEQQPGDMIYSAPSGLPLMVYADMPLYFSPTSDRLGEALSIGTQDAIGMQRVWFEDLPEEWDRVWLLWSTLPGDDPEDSAYIAGIVDRYASRRVAVLADDPVVRGSLWLVENSPSQSVNASPR